jgi:4-amino-4-deoxy-L-arabinose transferase-like glycosyltransferase
LTRWLIVIVGASAALAVWQIDWGLPSDYGWAPDELVPSAVLAGAAQGFSHGWYEKYPPFHYALLAVSYVPVAAAMRVLAPGAGPSEIIHALFLAGRLLSAAMAIGSIVLVYRVSRVIEDETAAVLAAGLAAFTPTFVYYAKVANLDVPYLFWFCLSLLFYVRSLARRQMRDYVAFAMAAAAAVATKDQAYGLYAGMLPFLIWRLRDRRLLPAAAAGALTLLVLDNALLNPSGLREHFRLAAGPASRAFRVFPATARGELLLVLDVLRQLRFVLGWPALLVCAAGIAVAVRERASLLLATLVPVASYLIVFVGVVLYVYDRFLLPVTVVMALLGGAFLSRLIRWSRALGLAVAAVVLGWSAARAASVDLMMASDGRYDVEERLRREAAGALVAAAGPLEYLPRLDGLRWRRLGPSVRRLSEMKPDLVVVNADYARRADPGTGERQLYDALEGGSAGYTLDFSHRSRPRFSLLREDEWSAERALPILTNLDKIGPEIRVYRRLR